MALYRHRPRSYFRGSDPMNAGRAYAYRTARSRGYRGASGNSIAAAARRGAIAKMGGSVRARRPSGRGGMG